MGVQVRPKFWLTANAGGSLSLTAVQVSRVVVGLHVRSAIPRNVSGNDTAVVLASPTLQVNKKAPVASRPEMRQVWAPQATRDTVPAGIGEMVIECHPPVGPMTCAVEVAPASNVVVPTARQ